MSVSTTHSPAQLPTDTEYKNAFKVATMSALDSAEEDDDHAPVPVNGRTTGRYARQGYCEPSCAC